MAERDEHDLVVIGKVGWGEGVNNRLDGAENQKWPIQAALPLTANQSRGSIRPPDACFYGATRWSEITLSVRLAPST